MKDDGPPNNPTAGDDPIRTGESAAGTTRSAAALAYRAAPALAGAVPVESPPGVRREYLQQVIHDTLRPVAARIGLAWVVTLMFLACFAPFIASSHPILMKVDGAWSSPLLRHLDAIDVALPATFVAAAVLVLRKPLSVPRGLALVAWVFFLTYAFSTWRMLPDKWADLRRDLSLFSALSLFGCAGAVVLAGIALPPLLWLPRRAVLWTVGVMAPLLLVLVLFPVRPPKNVVYERARELEKAGKVESILRTPIPYGPVDRMRDVVDNRLQQPNRTHWAGTDNYGADLLSRMIHGCRIALAIGFIATGIEVTLGVLIGGLMGYFAGWVDLIGMRLIEILESIPTLVLLIAVTAAWGRNLYLMMVIIGLLRWTSDARFIRAEFLKLRKQDFVQAAIATGLPLRSILFRHMLPNGISPVLVSASFGVASAILLEATLSFLGLGLVDEPSWGEMLNQARSGGAGFNWWIATFPGALIFLTVFSYNLVGEAIRDALDPKLLKRE